MTMAPHGLEPVREAATDAARAVWTTPDSSPVRRPLQLLLRVLR